MKQNVFELWRSLPETRHALKQLDEAIKDVELSIIGGNTDSSLTVEDIGRNYIRDSNYLRGLKFIQEIVDDLEE